MGRARLAERGRGTGGTGRRSGRVDGALAQAAQDSVMEGPRLGGPGLAGERPRGWAGGAGWARRWGGRVGGAGASVGRARRRRVGRRAGRLHRWRPVGDGSAGFETAAFGRRKARRDVRRVRAAPHDGAASKRRRHLRSPHPLLLTAPSPPFRLAGVRGRPGWRCGVGERFRPGGEKRGEGAGWRAGLVAEVAEVAVVGGGGGRWWWAVAVGGGRWAVAVGGGGGGGGGG